MLSGKVALVTGSSSGIGRAIAEDFAANGADVVVNYHANQTGAEAAAEAVRGAGQQARVVQADVSDPAEAAALVETAVDDLGGLDVLVNNAGIYPRLSWDDLDWEQWSRTMNVNVGGLINTSKAALPTLRDQGEGAVINMTSMWAFRGGSGNVPYTASKGAIRSLTYQMCAAFAEEGLRVNAISPGAIATAMNAESREDDEYVEEVTSMIPQGRFGDPEEIATVASFLASDAGRYVNGAVVPVDGGLLAT
ncbi:SDR family NAD(P)-dependent oxidoreductase [Halobacteriales archaeon Cl-PHB]